MNRPNLESLPTNKIRSVALAYLDYVDSEMAKKDSQIAQLKEQLNDALHTPRGHIGTGP